MHTRTSRLYLVAGTSGLTVPSSTAAGPGVTAVVPFQFPRRLLLQGLLAIPRENAAANAIEIVAAGLSISVIDDQGDAFVSDGRGTQIPATGGGLFPTGAGLLLLSGRGFRPWAMQRKAGTHDRWGFQLANAIASIATMAGIYLFGETDE